MAPLNILSLNVQGINVPQKRTKAFRFFQAQKAHIVCLQETHFTVDSTPKYMSSSYPQIYTASATTKKRGTLIAFHRSIPFILKSEIKDPEGRYYSHGTYFGYSSYSCVLLRPKQTAYILYVSPSSSGIHAQDGYNHCVWRFKLGPPPIFR